MINDKAQAKPSPNVKAQMTKAAADGSGWSEFITLLTPLILRGEPVGANEKAQDRKQ